MEVDDGDREVLLGRTSGIGPAAGGDPLGPQQRRKLVIEASSQALIDQGVELAPAVGPPPG